MALDNWLNPSGLRRIIFHTTAEWDAAHGDLDCLLATCWNTQHDILDRLPASREREIASQKLEEFACYARLAILAARAKDNDMGNVLVRVRPVAPGESA